MNREQVIEKMNSFPRWHYQFDLNGTLTPIFNPAHVNRHRQRKSYFIDPVVQLMGGTLRGKRILDLGCNAGYWALQVIGHDCDYVLGIDGRQMHIDQANFVFQVREIPRAKYDFVRANVFDYEFERHGPFDIVLLLGLLYHVSKPMTLFEKIARMNTDLLVIDTSISLAPGSWLKVRKENIEDPKNSVDYDLIMSPTRQAVIDMAEQFGYGVIVLRPRFTDYTGSVGYKCGRRRAFLCAKKTSLSHEGLCPESNGLLALLGNCLRLGFEKMRRHTGGAA